MGIHMGISTWGYPYGDPHRENLIPIPIPMGMGIPMGISTPTATLLVIPYIHEVLDRGVV